MYTQVYVWAHAHRCKYNINTHKHTYIKRWKLGKDLLSGHCFFMGYKPRGIFLSQPSSLLMLLFALAKWLLMGLQLLPPVFKIVLIDPSNLWGFEEYIDTRAHACACVCVISCAITLHVWEVPGTLSTHLHTAISVIKVLVQICASLERILLVSFPITSLLFSLQAVVAIDYCFQFLPPECKKIRLSLDLFCGRYPSWKVNEVPFKIQSHIQAFISQTLISMWLKAVHSNCGQCSVILSGLIHCWTLFVLLLLHKISTMESFECIFSSFWMMWSARASSDRLLSDRLALGFQCGALLLCPLEDGFTMSSQGKGKSQEH